jgi:glycosyltransferase involved in cell wall biosynthesis
MSIRLSVVIPTKNCVDLLRHSLPALDFADEIIVVDQFSTDGTAEYVRSRPKCRLLQQNAYIYENLNAGIDAAQGDWIMRIDSDEVCTPELGREIREAMESAPQDVIGFRVLSRAYYAQRWLKYGPAYDETSPVPGERYRKMVFRRGAARYECKSEHEDLTTLVPGRWAALRQRYDHYSTRSFGHYIQKINYYSDRDAERVDRSKYSTRSEAWAMLWSPIKTFLVFFLKRKRYKDGALRVMACGGYAVSEFLTHAKRWRGSRSSRMTWDEQVRVALEQTRDTHLLQAKFVQE